MEPRCLLSCSLSLENQLFLTSSSFKPHCVAACLLCISVESLLLSCCLTHVTGVCLSFLLSVKSFPCFPTTPLPFSVLNRTLTMFCLLLLFSDCFPHSRILMFHVSLLLRKILNLLILFSLKYLFLVLNVFDVVCLGFFRLPL